METSGADRLSRRSHLDESVHLEAILPFTDSGAVTNVPARFCRVRMVP